MDNRGKPIAWRVWFNNERGTYKAHYADLNCIPRVDDLIVCQCCGTVIKAKYIVEINVLRRDHGKVRSIRKNAKQRKDSKTESRG